MKKYYGIIHYANANNIICSNSNSIYLLNTLTNEKRIISKDSINIFQKNFNGNILSRLFRWNQCNLHVIDFDKGDLVYTGNGKISSIRECKIVSDYTLLFGRTYLRNPFCCSNNGIYYFADYHSNKNRNPINIYKSNDLGMTWERFSPFSDNFCKHAHGIFYDRYTNSKWIATGDANSESYICQLHNNDKDYDIIGGGSQTWRTCHLFFREENIFWFTDSPIDQNYLIKYNRKSGKIDTVANIPGPVISAAEYEDGILASTSVEPGAKHNSSFIIYTKNFEDIEILAKFRKDIYPFIFGFGNINFSYGSKSFIDAYCSFHSIKNFDQISIPIKDILGYGIYNQLP